jgi:polysaccharide transporter, PST family
MNYRFTALSGMAWVMLSQGLRMVLQFATTLILARLLMPEDFGVFAMMLPVAGLVALLQDFGLHQSLVQKEKITHDQINAIFWINFSISMALAVLLVLCSPLVGAFYGEPRLVPLVAGWSAMLIIGSLSFGQYAMLSRVFRFRTLAMIEMTCAISSSVGSILIAYIWASYWALWWSGIISVATWGALTYATKSWSPTRPKRGVDLDGMLSFGLNLLGHHGAEYVSRNLDTILIGRTLGGNILGFYDRAYKLLLYPLENLAGPANRVMVPILSRLNNDPAAFRRAYVQVSGILNLAIMPGMAVAIGCSEHVVRILLGEKWMASAPIFHWLGFAGLFQPFISSVGFMLIAQGRSRELMITSVSSSCVTAVGFIIGLNWGVVGVAAAYACAECLYRTPLLCYFAGRHGSVSIGDLAASFMPMLVSAGLIMAIIPALESNGFSSWSLIIVSLVISYAISLAVLSLLPSGRVLLGAALKAARDGAGWLLGKFGKPVPADVESP